MNLTPGRRQEVGAVLAAHGLTLTGEPTLVAHSVVNENYRCPTTQGVVFTKLHRANRTRERLEREQSASAWAGNAGVPVVSPLRSRAGETLLEYEGRFWSVWPWIDADTWRRGEMAEWQARKLGAVHGRLQVALAGHRGEGLSPNSELTWDTDASLAVLADLAPRVATNGTAGERRWVERQRQLLNSGKARPPSDFAGLPMQATHGDFHERNVMFDGAGNVIAVVDWERFCLQPPAFEVLRAVSFMLLLDEAMLRAYLEGFRTESRLDRDTVAPSIEAWRQSSMHNTWALRDYFLDGNEATRQFIPQEEARSAKFNDPGFRTWLREMIERYAS